MAPTRGSPKRTASNRENGERGHSANGKGDQRPSRPVAKNTSARRLPLEPSDKALVISGCSGKYSVINNAYEPRGLHAGFPCWVSHNSTCCIFHTGKSRWVIGKEMDDGAKCYAFIKDNGVDNPAECTGHWTICDDRGEWREDRNIACSFQRISKDPFVRLRYVVEDEMKTLRIETEADRASMWRRLDRNGDGTAEIAEVEVLVDDLVRSGTWPRWVNNQNALEGAYKKTLEDSIEHDDVVMQEDFHALVLNIFWFGKLHEVYQSIDTGDDDTIDLAEFKAGMESLDVELADPEAEFNNMDKDNSSLVDFSEFCSYVRKRMHPDTQDGRLQADDHKLATHEQMRSTSGDVATTGAMVRKKNFEDFDKLEKNIKDICNEPDQKGLKRLWKQLDFNGNNLVSLAEIDKWVVERYPLLNHKPALIRAQKATLQGGNGDDWVEKKEFKFLLTNLFYFNKIFWLFDQADEGQDRRVDFKEFQFLLSLVGIRSSATKAKSEFDRIDVNKGGQVLFDEFCVYVVEKRCPEGMTGFIADE